MYKKPEGYYEMILVLSDKNYPATMTKKQAQSALGVSRSHLETMIRNKSIKVKDGKITIGAVARYLCD